MCWTQSRLDLSQRRRRSVWVAGHSRIRTHSRMLATGLQGNLRGSRPRPVADFETPGKIRSLPTEWRRLACCGATVVVLSTRMSAIIGRFGTARVSVLAFASLVAGYAVFLRVGVQPDYASVILPAVVLIGIAFGLGFSALSLAATDGVADAEQGLAASLFQTSFQVGGAIVLAIVTAVVDAGGASQITSAQATLGAYRPALAVITVVSALGAVTAISGLRSARRGPRPAPVPVPVPARVPAAGLEPAMVTEAALDGEVDLVTGTARELEEDCATPLCL